MYDTAKLVFPLSRGPITLHVNGWTKSAVLLSGGILGGLKRKLLSHLPCPPQNPFLIFQILHVLSAYHHAVLDGAVFFSTEPKWALFTLNDGLM